MNENMYPQSLDAGAEAPTPAVPPIDVKVFPTQGDGKLLAKASVTLGGCFTIDQIKLYNTDKGLFVAMPSARGRDGIFRDICHPATKEMREALNSAVIEQYQQTVELISARGASAVQKSSVREALQEAREASARTAPTPAPERKQGWDAR